MFCLLIAGGIGALSWWITDRLVTQSSFLHSLDHPNERSLHSRPVPRTGGIAIVSSLCIGVIVASLWALWREDMTEDTSRQFIETIWILGSTFFLSAVSLLDDRRGLPVVIRFGLQFLAACAVVFGGKIFFHSITIPLAGTINLGYAAIPLTVIFLLWMTNLYNFMDGMDGFAGGMTAVGFGLLGYFAGTGGHPLMFCVAVIHAAAATGFLFSNFPPAKIFMGDVGSISTGYLAGSLIVLGCRDGLFDPWVPLMAFSPFIVDATVTVMRRALQGKKIWEAHREHFYQRLVLSGWGHRKTVLAEYVMMLASGALCLAYQYAADEGKLGLLILWAAFYLALAVGVRRVEHGRRAAV
ncbi:MAG TPA: glycosyltransferase family 4 protein [Nitrospira sp.]